MMPPMTTAPVASATLGRAAHIMSRAVPIPITLSRSTALVVVGALVLVAGPRGQAQDADLAATLYDRYVAGEHDVFARLLPNYTTYRANERALRRNVAPSPETWQPARATFLLELSLWVACHGWPGGRDLVDRARLSVRRHLTPEDTDQAARRFEQLFHQTMIAGLISGSSWVEANRYLDALDADGPHALAPRVVFARGWLEETRTEQGRSTTFGPGMPTLLARSDTTRRALERAAALFAQAADEPGIGEEARVRRAFALHRLDRQAEALEALPSPVANDSVLEYWRLLIGGRILEANGRPTDAGRDYAAAAALWPNAQTPAVALTSLLARHGQPREAERWAAAGRHMTTATSDPWWFYWAADQRWMPRWLEELRSAQP